jgi:polyisoprenoid-binding protein YceI
MKRELLNAVLAAHLLNLCVEAADSYKIDPVHTSVGFSVRHMVISSVRGKFKEFSGTVVVDHGNIEAATALIQTKSIDTGVSQRDDDLRSPNFFDVEKHPSITFKSKRIEKNGDQNVLVGDYTMHGVTKELSLPVKLTGPIKDPWGNSRIGLEAKTKLNRKDFGMSYNKMLETGGLLVGDEVEIEINAEAVKSPAP